MDIQDLKYYVRVCEERNISRAAETMFISQQAMSKAIGRLEEELDVELFSRSHSGVEMTEFGEAFFAYAMSEIENREKLLAQMKELKAPSMDRVTLGFGSGMTLHFPDTFFSEFIEAHPGARICLNSYQDDPYHRATIPVSCEVLLVSDPPLSSRYTVRYKKCTKLAIAMAKTNPLAEKEVLTWEDLERAVIIQLNVQNRYNADLGRQMAAHGITPQYLINPAECRLSEQLMRRQNAVTVYGGNRAVLPDWMTLVPVRDLPLTMDFYLCVLKEVRLNPTGKALVTVLEDALKNMKDS